MPRLILAVLPLVMQWAALSFVVVRFWHGGRRPGATWVEGLRDLTPRGVGRRAQWAALRLYAWLDSVGEGHDHV